MTRFTPRILSRCAVGFLLLALALACVYSNNDFLGRMSVPCLFLIISGLASLLQILAAKVEHRMGWAFFLLVVTTGYFVIRALISPVEYLATKDSLLFLSALMAAFTVAIPENRKLLTRVLPWAMLSMILLQCVVIPYQWDHPEYVPFREDISGKREISGFFGHRNFFALLMGCLSLGLLIYALIYPLRDRTARVCRVIWMGAALLGLVMMCYSGSRGAWVAVSAATGLAVGVYIVWRVSVGRSSLAGALRLSLVALVTGGVLVVWVGGLITHRRGMEQEGFFFANARQDLLLLASDCEPENPLWGGGARFFSYEARRVWDDTKLNNTLGDPKVVHNEYVEALVNYGYVGMILLVVLIYGFMVLSIRQIIMVGSLAGDDERRRWLAMQLTMLGLMVAIMIQSAVDFSLHVLPIIMLLGVAFGVTARGRSGRLLTLVNGLAVSLAMIAAMVLAAPHWGSLWREEMARSIKQEQPLQAAYELLQVGQKTGDFDVTHEAAQLILLEKGGSPEGVEEAVQAYTLASQQHPYFGAVWMTRARLAFYQGHYAEALELLSHAEHWVGNSEHRYGVKYWKAIISYAQERQNLAAPATSTVDLLAKVNRLETYEEAFTTKFYGVQRDDAWVAEIRAIRCLFQGRFAAREALREGQAGRLSWAMAYARYAIQRYAMAERFAKGYRTERDLSILELLERQVQYMKRRSVRAEPELRKRLDSGILSR